MIISYENSKGNLLRNKIIDISPNSMNYGLENDITIKFVLSDNNILLYDIPIKSLRTVSWYANESLRIAEKNNVTISQDQIQKIIDGIVSLYNSLGLSFKEISVEKRIEDGHGI